MKPIIVAIVFPLMSIIHNSEFDTRFLFRFVKLSVVLTCVEFHALFHISNELFSEIQMTTEGRDLFRLPEDCIKFEQNVT